MKLIFLILFSFSAFADPADDLFTSANEDYQAKEYSSAITKYIEIENNGFHSAELYYNMGNTYYKAGKIASAILYYEKAKVLDPSNEDIDFNLKIAELQIIDKVDEVPQLFIFDWLDSFINMNDADSWSILSIISFILAAVLLILFLFTISQALKKLSLLISFIMIIFTIITYYSASSRNELETNNSKAVVMSPSAYVKSSPNDESTDLFILHEGTRCFIQDEIGDWLEIRILDGNVGWIKRSAIERV